MIPFIILIVFQIFIAGIVIVVLKHFLNRELEKAAIEKFMSLKTSDAVKLVHVYQAASLSPRGKEELKALTKNKFVNGEIVFEELRGLKGGLMIKVETEILDFSVSSRLENFWS